MEMFGYKTIKTSEYDAMRNEIKGFYAETEDSKELFRLIQSQLKGIDAGNIKSISRDELKDAYESIAPVMGVINYIADNVGEVSRYLELRDIKRDVYIQNHWIIDLLNRPNDRFTRRKFFTAWAINRLLFGEAFVFAPKGVGKDRKPKEMYVLSSNNVDIEKGGINKPFKGIKLNIASNDTIDLDDKVFQSFDYNLDMTSFHGTSKVAAAAVYLSVIDRAMNRQSTTLKNGGAANIITPAASANTPALPQQIDDMEQKANKPSNANKNLAMRMAIQVHKLGDNPVNLSILESHKDAINALCFVFKLPVDLYLGQSKYENAKEAKKTIYEQNAIPLVNEFAEDFLHYLGLEKQFELVVNTDEIEVLKNSRKETLETLEKMHASLNELREANGYEALNADWANEPIIPMGVQFGNEAMNYDINE